MTNFNVQEFELRMQENKVLLEKTKHEIDRIKKGELPDSLKVKIKNPLYKQFLNFDCCLEFSDINFSQKEYAFEELLNIFSLYRLNKNVFLDKVLDVYALIESKEYSLENFPIFKGRLLKSALFVLNKYEYYSVEEILQKI